MYCGMSPSRFDSAAMYAELPPFTPPSSLYCSHLQGGNGVLFENHVIRHVGDLAVIHTYEGTDTMQLLIVGRDIAGVGAYV